jgi:tRNA (cmo5U34)-methyltransferase
MKKNQKLKQGKDFSFENIIDFDNHISKSIIGFEGIVKDILILSEYFVEKNQNYYDIGCSTGKLVKAIGKKYKQTNCVGIEIEGNFEDDMKTLDNVRFDKSDVRHYHFRDSCFITSIFTIQFLPVKDRLSVLKKLYESLNKGGAFVLFEKMFFQDVKVNSMFHSIHYDYKLESFDKKEIFDKERSLRQLMKIKTLEENISDLNKVGFNRVEVIWKRHSFVGLIAIK